MRDLTLFSWTRTVCCGEIVAVTLSKDQMEDAPT